MILTARQISRATYILRTRSIYSARARTHYSKTMNNYPQDFYSEIEEYIAVYNNNNAVYNARKYKKNARRSQRKNKQAQRNARYDQF